MGTFLSVILPAVVGVATGLGIGVVTSRESHRPAEGLCTRPGHACGTEGAGPCNGHPRRS